MDGIPVYRGTPDIVVGMIGEKKKSSPPAIEKVQGMPDAQSKATRCQFDLLQFLQSQHAGSLKKKPGKKVLQPGWWQDLSTLWFPGWSP